VLLPNRAFDLQTEAAVGGSIIKQYKAECERAEKAKAEADAKAAAAAEARRVQEARENRAKESSIVSSNQASVSSATASASDVDNAHMSDAEHSAVGAPQPPPPAAAASASSSSSASVAPLPDVAAGDEDPVAKCVETYENLRPVWHDGMNAYVVSLPGLLLPPLLQLLLNQRRPMRSLPPSWELGDCSRAFVSLLACLCSCTSTATESARRASRISNCQFK